MRRRLARVTAVLLLVVAAGCGGQDDTEGTAAAAPVKGGTLYLLSETPLDAADTKLAYTVSSWTLARLYTRQLYSWTSARPGAAAGEPVPDIATGPPEISGGGTVYTFRLRPDVRFAPPVNRAVTAQDFVYAVERQLDPDDPSPNQYNSVIKGADEFAAGKARTISGLEAIDDTTLRITLTQPAGDFLSIISAPFYAPVAEEHAAKYPGPGAYSEAYRGAGPYVIESYEPDKQVTLVRNPNWEAASDPLRKAWVDRVELRVGVDPTAAQQQLERGDQADLSLDSKPPPADLQRLATDPTLSKQFVNPDTSCLLYLSLQTDSGPTAKLQVRQAINYAVDKAAIVRVLGGPLTGSPATTILPPTLSGHEQTDLYATSGHRGDPDRARKLLAEAGYPDGVTINMVAEASGDGPDIVTSLRESLGRAGIRLNVKTYEYPAILTDSLSLPSKKDEHQIGHASFCADWAPDGGRTFFSLQLDGRNIIPEGNSNFASYNDPQVNQLIDRALAAPDLATRASIWAEADRTAMADAPWAPLVYPKDPRFHSARVRDYLVPSWMPSVDLANLWLDQTAGQ